MKKITIPTLILALATLIAFSGCSTSENAMQSGEQAITADTGSEYWTLEDYLRRINGVQVRQSGGTVYLSIRGHNSIENPDAQPLFIVNGQKIGRNYSFVSSLFSPGEIQSVRVLPTTQTSIYGMEGNYGVILIRTKSQAKISANHSEQTTQAK